MQILHVDSEQNPESESDSAAGEATALGDLPDLLLNTISACAHKSVWCSKREGWVLACRPHLELGSNMNAGRAIRASMVTQAVGALGRTAQVFRPVIP